MRRMRRLRNRFAGDDLELTAGPEIGAAGVAAAEVADATLGELFVAMAVASELENYLRGWLQMAVERHRLHPPALFGAFAATAVASKLLALDRDTFAGALAAGLALTPQSPYASFSAGATGKWLYGAWSQRLGVQCALWARAGMTGALSTLEGPRGVAQAFLHDRSPAPEFHPDGWAIENVTFKPFPCSRACHPALTATEQLVQLGPLEPDLIERIDIWSYPFSVDLEEQSTKANSIASQMSISAMVAQTLGTAAPITVSREGSSGLPRIRPGACARDDDRRHRPGRRLGSEVERRKPRERRRATGALRERDQKPSRLRPMERFEHDARSRGLSWLSFVS